jgi:hypothetical protein
VRNQGVSVFQPRDFTRSVTASQFGQRSPSGKMKKKTTVAAIKRRIKKPTKMKAKMTASDIVAASCYSRCSTWSHGST